MGAHEFGDERIKATDKLAGRILIVPERCCHERACVRFLHVVAAASTLTSMTAPRASRLRIYRIQNGQISCRGDRGGKRLVSLRLGVRRGERRYSARQDLRMNKCNQQAPPPVISFRNERTTRFQN